VGAPIGLSWSSDDAVVGIEAEWVTPGRVGSRKPFHFRLAACAPNGKDGPSLAAAARLPASAREEAWTPKKVAEVLLPLIATEPDQNSGRKPQSESEQETFSSGADMGFGIRDQGPATWPADLPRFELAAEYDKARYSASTDRPWRGLDLTSAEQRERFASMLLPYFYQGMVDQDRRPDWNLIPQQNKRRSWCHMPWLGTGVRGREAVHGLTRMRDMDVPNLVYEGATRGSNWGVGFYNAVGCEALKKSGVLGSSPKKGLILVAPSGRAWIGRPTSETERLAQKSYSRRLN
jgi:hypothetical protein